MAAKKKKTARKPKTAAGKKPIALEEKRLVAPKRRKEVVALMNKINRSAKKTVLQFAEDAPNTFHLRRPTGIMQLDVDLAGGFPAGAFSTISGPDGSGKTTLLYMIFAMQQRLFGNESYIAYCSPESAIDFWWARKIGWVIAFPDKVIEEEQEVRTLRGLPKLTKDEVLELKREVGTNIVINGDDGESILNNLERTIRTGVFNIVALDSLESILPNAEAKLDDYHDNPQQASRATIVSRFMQHWGSMMNGVDGANYTTFISTCQVRANRKKSEAAAHIAKYLKDWDTTAPRAVRHWRMIDLIVMDGAKLKNQVDGVKLNRGKMMKWETGKGKVGTHEGITGEIEFEYEGLIDQAASILIAGVRQGVIEERDGLFTLHKEAGEDEDWTGIDRDEFLLRIREDIEIELMIRREILAAAGARCSYR